MATYSYFTSYGCNVVGMIIGYSGTRTRTSLRKLQPRWPAVNYTDFIDVTCTHVNILQLQIKPGMPTIGLTIYNIPYPLVFLLLCFKTFFNITKLQNLLLVSVLLLHINIYFKNKMFFIIPVINVLYNPCD